MTALHLARSGVAVGRRASPPQQQQKHSTRDGSAAACRMAPVPQGRGSIAVAADLK